MYSATGFSHPNIALIKYWGNQDDKLRIPANGSISMNLNSLYTRTEVWFDPQLEHDELFLEGHQISGTAQKRVRALLDRVRDMAGFALHARIYSHNNFPAGTGIASSASAFAALTVAACCAAGLELSQRDLSRLARTGSGSACRSIPGGFVEWQAGYDDVTSYAFTIAPASHWDLVDCIAIVSQEPKHTSSEDGHALAGSSTLQTTRLADTPGRLDICRQAIQKRDFDALAEVVELDSNLMHAVIMTSNPPLLYWQPATLAVMHAVKEIRNQGTAVCYTIDAGPNVHVICQKEDADYISAQLNQIPGVQKVLTAHPGGPAHCIKNGDESIASKPSI
ncbi:diphosphomevalonate decarboxylase [Chloroflexota bacterium]